MTTPTWREYHEETKHTRASLRQAPHYLDWHNMPDAFRHYEGVPLLDLPAGPESPGANVPCDGPAFFSQLLFYSAAISASKRVPATGGKYALRVNPSSGNLHPTEFHFVARGLRNWPDGLFHYRPSSHMAEVRGQGDFESSGIAAPVVFVLTSIAWREAWKYRSRAYRYCLHDIGHAWQSLAMAAHAMGCQTRAIGHFADDEIARLCGLSLDEWPMLLLELHGPAIPLRASGPAGDAAWFGGCPNQLSRETVQYPSIDALHLATKLDSGCGPVPSGSLSLPSPAGSLRGLGELARRRRSALDFVGGDRTMSLAQLSAILNAGCQPMAADFAEARFIQLYLYVHRVNQLAPGLYRYSLAGGGLELLREGDQRVAAAGLSLGQDLAGNACVAFSMVADLDRAARAHGDRGYRYAHFEAGAIGQRFYIAAEAAGLRATGIGAFFDDEVNRYLDLAPGQGQVIYHFAIGYPVSDPRLDA